MLASGSGLGHRKGQGSVEALRCIIDNSLNNGWLGLQPHDELVHVAQPGTLQQPLLIGDPFATSGKHGVCGHRTGYGQGAGELSEPPAAGVCVPRVAECHVGPVHPKWRCCFPEELRIVRVRHISPKGAVDGEFGDYQIAGDSRQMEEERLNVEPSLLRLGQLMLNDVEVAIVDVNASTMDVQPCPAVEDPTTPAANLGHHSLPAKFPQVVRIETLPIVQCEVPVAVRTVCASGPGSPEGYRKYPGKIGKAIRHMINKYRIFHCNTCIHGAITGNDTRSPATGDYGWKKKLEVSRPGEMHVGFVGVCSPIPA